MDSFTVSTLVHLDCPYIFSLVAFTIFTVTKSHRSQSHCKKSHLRRGTCCCVLPCSGWLVWMTNWSNSVQLWGRVAGMACHWICFRTLSKSQRLCSIGFAWQRLCRRRKNRAGPIPPGRDACCFCGGGTRSLDPVGGGLAHVSSSTIQSSYI